LEPERSDATAPTKATAMAKQMASPSARALPEAIDQVAEAQELQEDGGDFENSTSRPSA